MNSVESPGGEQNRDWNYKPSAHGVACEATQHVYFLRVSVFSHAKQSVCIPWFYKFSVHGQWLSFPKFCDLVTCSYASYQNRGQRGTNCFVGSSAGDSTDQSRNGEHAFRPVPMRLLFSKFQLQSLLAELVSVLAKALTLLLNLHAKLLHLLLLFSRSSSCPTWLEAVL